MLFPTVSTEPLVQTLGIVGVGLIGGSIALAAQMREVAQRVIGFGRNPERLGLARDIGVITDVAAHLGQLSEAELIVVCTPVDRIVDDVLAIARAVGPKPLITDAGSVKGAICKPLYEQLPTQFVGSHPLAGSERGGFEHAHPQLFDDRVCVVTPGPESPAEQVQRVVAFWEAIGMRVEQLDPQRHDEYLACTSHLPHVAASLVAMQLTPEGSPFAATGFRDTTRVAAGDAHLWSAILRMNAVAVGTELDRLIKHAQTFRDALQQPSDATLIKLLAMGQQGRALFEQTHASE